MRLNPNKGWHHTEYRFNMPSKVFHPFKGPSQLGCVFAIALLILFSPLSYAKKLYKFQDDKGRWHFSDKPPKTDRKVAVEQLRVKPKKYVWLEQRILDQRPEYYMVNRYHGAIETQVAFDEQENTVADPPLPRRFRLAPEDPTRLWRADFRYRYVPGDPAAKHDPMRPYLPPIASGQRFQISQGFNGKHSHHDPQNQFAVDIAMQRPAKPIVRKP